MLTEQVATGRIILDTAHRSAELAEAPPESFSGRWRVWLTSATNACLDRPR